MSRELKRQAVESLSDEGRALLSKIETSSGIDVGFALYKFPPRPNSINPIAPATQVSHDSATIYVHGTDPEHLWGIPHELLHIYRYWCEGVPQLHPIQTGDQSNLVACGNVENAIEHLVIVPREPQYGLNSADHWRRVAKAKWQGYPWPDITDPEGRRGNALLGRLELELTTDATVIELAERCLANEGLAGDAKRFAARIRQLLDSKPRCLSAAVRFLKWPKHQLHLVYLDPRKRERRTAPLPDH